VSSRIAPLLVLLTVASTCASPTADGPVGEGPPTTSSATLPPDATTERSVALLLSMLDQRAMQRKGFTATYHVQAGDSEQTIRYAYLAPDRVRMDVRYGTTTHTTWSSEGAMAMSIGGDARAQVVRYDTKDLDTTWEECDAALDKAFPPTGDAAAPLEELESGPLLEFGIRPEPGSSEHGSFSSSVSWSPARPSFLSWLAPREWDRAHVVDAQTIEVTRGAKKAVLSAATGMFLKMTFGERFQASLVDSTDVVDPSEFAALTAATAGDPSTSAAAEKFESEMFRHQRERVLQRIVAAAHGTKEDSAAVLLRAKPVLEALYRVILKRHYAGWLKDYGEKIDAYFEKIESGYATIRSDQNLRDSFDRQMADWRSSIQHQLLAARDEGAATFGPSSVAPGETTMQTQLLELERSAMIAVFELEISDALLLHLDERLKALREKT
jgi:hypothetical protein